MENSLEGVISAPVSSRAFSMLKPVEMREFRSQSAASARWRPGLKVICLSECDSGNRYAVELTIAYKSD